MGIFDMFRAEKAPSSAVESGVEIPPVVEETQANLEKFEKLKNVDENKMTVEWKKDAIPLLATVLAAAVAAGLIGTEGMKYVDDLQAGIPNIGGNLPGQAIAGASISAAIALCTGVATKWKAMAKDVWARVAG